MGAIAVGTLCWTTVPSYCGTWPVGTVVTVIQHNTIGPLGIPAVCDVATSVGDVGSIFSWAHLRPITPPPESAPTDVPRELEVA